MSELSEQASNAPAASFSAQTAAAAEATPIEAAGASVSTSVSEQSSAISTSAPETGSEPTSLTSDASNERTESTSPASSDATELNPLNSNAAEPSPTPAEPPITPESLQQLWHPQLQEWASEGELLTAASTALHLDSNHPPEQLKTLIANLAAGETSDIPPIELLQQAAMSGAAGAYAESTGTIYLNKSWLSRATNKQTISVLTEEFGHHLDHIINKRDTPGDEGLTFSNHLTQQTAEIDTNDRHISTGLIFVDGTWIKAEFSFTGFTEFGGNLIQPNQIQLTEDALIQYNTLLSQGQELTYSYGGIPPTIGILSAEGQSILDNLGTNSLGTAGYNFAETSPWDLRYVSFGGWIGGTGTKHALVGWTDNSSQTGAEGTLKGGEFRLSYGTDGYIRLYYQDVLKLTSASTFTGDQTLTLVGFDDQQQTNVYIPSNWTLAPIIALTADVASLNAGETASLSFSLSEASSDFTVDDVTVSGGTLSNFSGSGTSYSATFTPTADSTTDGVISVGSGVFSNSSGANNADGSDANNSVTLSVDTVRPTIAVSSDVSSLSAGETATLTFTLSESSTDFVEADVSITGGNLSNFSGSGSSYSATFTPDTSSDTNEVISIASGVFADAAGNTNADGGDSNNSVTLTVDTVSAPPFTRLGNDIDGEAAGDESGSVALSSDGTILAIGAHYNDGGGNRRGRTRIYAWNSGTSRWDQRGDNINGEWNTDYSGSAVSISDDGSVVAIGAISNNGDGNGNESGHTRIYAWDGSAWVQRGGDINGEASNDNSGGAVSLSSDGSVVAIGAKYNDNASGDNAGHTRVYAWNGTAWVQRGTDIDGETAQDLSGCAVTLSGDGNTLAIGAQQNSGGGNKSGHTRIYTWNGTAWVKRGDDIDGESGGDQSGLSVSLSTDGNVVAIGGKYNDGNGSDSGHTRIYDWDGTAWVKRGEDIDGESAGDRSGAMVSLSGDGNVVAIGAPQNAANGTNSGHTRIYQWDGTAWNHIGSDIDGEAADDYSGGQISLSRDGSTVAIGSIFNDDNGSSAGHVRVFRLTDLTAPTIAVTDDDADNSLSSGDTSTLTFTLSEAATDFVESDVAVSGGSLSNWTAVSSTVYTATFTPTSDSTTDGVISVASSKFSDAAGNTNNDGADADNSVNFSIDTRNQSSGSSAAFASSPQESESVDLPSRPPLSGSQLIVASNRKQLQVTEGEGLWIQLEATGAVTEHHNVLEVTDNRGNTLGSVGATKWSTNLGWHEFYARGGTTFSFHSHQNQNTFSEFPEINFFQESDSISARLNDNPSIDEDSDDLQLRITSSQEASRPVAALLASQQKNVEDTILNFTEIKDNSQIKLSINSECDDTNQFALIKIDDFNDNEIIVNGISSQSKEAFRTAIEDELIHPDQGKLVTSGSGTQTASLTLNQSDQGFYAPVFINQTTNQLFTAGFSSASESWTQVRTLGRNFFGYEDTHDSNQSDWDFNDMTVNVELIT
ncbi:Ig-like domain-containing protein [Synechococcus sp. A15-60]|uniref:Ig-like domain-containing protein n=1 Tax=Synechococcus sp. A15-60 TaxID=1050655 RepID=UPI0016475047|nr:Ig-like domain-containing protein [Synechococcus sp. A15-60]